jgi:hypothetical protein
MLWTWMHKIQKYNLFIKIQIWKVPTLRTKGYTSLVPQTTLHCIFLDYDNTKDERLKEELQFLQEEFARAKTEPCKNIFHKSNLVLEI